MPLTFGPFDISEADGKVEMILDHQMFSTFALCETKFKYKHTLNQSRRGNIAWYPYFGQYFAEVLSDFYEDMKEDKLTFPTWLSKSIALWRQYKFDRYIGTEFDKMYRKFCGTIESQTQAPFGLIEILSNYFNRYASQDSKFWKIVSTEAGFGLDKSVLLGETDLYRVWSSGRPDLNVIEGPDLLTVDNKVPTSLYNFNKGWRPNHQMVGYVYATRVMAAQLGFNTVPNTCVINGIAREQGGDYMSSNNFDRLYLHYEDDDLEDYRQSKMNQASEIYQAIKNNKFTMAHEFLCHKQEAMQTGFYNSDCEFLSLCAARPSERELLMKANFQSTEGWKPYVHSKNKPKETINITNIIKE